MTSGTEKLKNNIAQNVRKYRKAMKISQRKFSIQADFSEDFIQMLETGKRTPSVDTLAKLAEVFGIEPYELLK